MLFQSLLTYKNRLMVAALIKQNTVLSDVVSDNMLNHA
jgi:hypothetical protein